MRQSYGSVIGNLAVQVTSFCKLKHDFSALQTNTKVPPLRGVGAAQHTVVNQIQDTA
jgi:hypothetical protein